MELYKQFYLHSFHFLTRTRNPKDDRVLVVELNYKGRLLKDEILEVPKQIYCKVGVNLEEFEVLKKSLDKLLINLS